MQVIPLSVSEQWFFDIMSLMTLDKLNKKMLEVKAECKAKGIELSDVYVEVNVPSEGDPEGCLTGIDLLFDSELKTLTIYPVCGWKE